MTRDPRHVLTELLVLRARAGDETAFAELYATWTTAFARLAFASLRDSQRVDEIVQEAWVQIARGLRRLTDPSSFASWAFRIVDRRCADALRARDREARRAISLPSESQLPPAPQDRPEESDLLAALRLAIARLDQQSQKLLHLFYDAGLSVAEIASLLGIPDGTVKSRLHSLRETLRRHLERSPS
jgi:RNA polymerase sigma factor (sigma-70 family)